MATRATDTTTRARKKSPPKQEKPVEKQQTPPPEPHLYRITGPAARAIEQVAKDLRLPAASLVDLAVRDWCRRWNPDLLP